MKMKNAPHKSIFHTHFNKYFKKFQSAKIEDLMISHLHIIFGRNNYF